MPYTKRFRSLVVTCRGVAPSFWVALKKSSLKYSEPLNIRCSNKWANPVLPGGSFFEPTWYQMFTATSGAAWSSCTTTVRPLGRTQVVDGPSSESPATGTAAASLEPGAAGRPDNP